MQRKGEADASDDRCGSADRKRLAESGKAALEHGKSGSGHSPKPRAMSTETSNMCRSHIAIPIYIRACDRYFLSKQRQGSVGASSGLIKEWTGCWKWKQ